MNERSPKTIEEKLCKFDIINECFIFNASKEQGYGLIFLKINGKKVKRRAHRIAYETYVGTVPDGKVLDHLCRNRACINVDHLEVVTNAENVLRGMGVAAINKRKTHCKRGHEFTTSNTKYYKSKYKTTPQRICRICDIEKQRVAREKIRYDKLKVIHG